ncbi:MAG: chromate efflux transporter [Anaerolineaceae bacterium]|nr:chromate efflux transporter [Anaerolineaceae bacterium]
MNDLLSTPKPVSEVEISGRSVSPEPEQESKSSRLRSLVLACLKIGLTSFGAPTAHIAMMENEFVRKRKWITEDQFLDMLGAANLIPGPNASEMAYHVGYVRAGIPGLILGGLAFILPAFLTSAILGMVYLKYGSLPVAGSLFYVLNPLVLAIVLDTTWRVSKYSLKGWEQFLIFGLTILASFFGANETVVLLEAGALGIFLHYWLKQRNKPGLPLLSFLPFPLMGLIPLLNNASPLLQNRLVQIFLYFLKTGFVLFGSSMVLFGLIQNDVVERFHWLTPQQLSDSIVVGQITPGPVLSSTSFIGFMAGGWGGAALATLGVFLPGFLLVAATAPILFKMRESKMAQGFLRGVNASVVALILMVAINLARSGLIDLWTVLLFLGGFFVLIRFELTPVYLVLFGILLGILKTFLIK